jgi:(R)-2-hydroxyacyl-CoA dehydratese activating ATPase
MKYYLGIDAGSSYTKFVVIDENKYQQFYKCVKTLTRNKEEENIALNKIFLDYTIFGIGATGYGRLYYKKDDENYKLSRFLKLGNYDTVVKTELYCASVGVTALYPIDKTIIDIGGEDVKVIKSTAEGKVLDFYMNTRCAAGTGSFINEVAERAEIDISEMSKLAEKSTYNKELNSFCTVFAKTEIMQWIFAQVPIEDIAKGIYISIVNRIKKIPMDKTLPIYLIGGAAEFHPYLKTVMQDIFKINVTVPDNPQFINAHGAAIFALNDNN